LTDSDNLISKIARLASREDAFDQGRRVLSGTGRDEILGAVLQEIDETVLARQLTFNAQPGHSIVLIAKGRRLQKICEIEPESLAAVGSDLISQYLSGQDDGHMVGLTQLMVSFAEGADRLSVSVDEIGAGGDNSAIGVSVQSLSAAWLPASSANGPVTLGDFLASCRGDLIASILLENGALVSQSGAEKQAKRLKELAESAADDIDAELRQLHAEGVENRLFVVDRKPGELICFSSDGDQMALLLIADEDLQKILTKWS
jgi:hypothetical protein